MKYSKRFGFQYVDSEDYNKKKNAYNRDKGYTEIHDKRYSKTLGFYYTSRSEYEEKKREFNRKKGKEQPIAIEKLDSVLFEHSDNNEFHMSKWDRVLEDLGNYVKTKEKGNYYGDDKVQVLDLLKSSGDLGSFCRGNAIKYITRAGRKAQSSELDLFKAIHYILIMILENEDADKQTNS